MEMKRIFLVLFICISMASCVFAQTKSHLSQINGLPAFFVDHYKYAADADDTPSFNRAITDAYKAQSEFNPAGEFSIAQNARVVCGSGKTYNVGGTILLPSQIALDLNGSILDGGADSSAVAYATSSRALIESAYWGSTQLVSNIGSNPVTRRLVKTVVTNGTIQNVPCGIRVQAFDEQSKISSIYFSGVARAIDVANSWYGEVEDVVVRASCVASGEAALAFSGEINSFVIRRSSFAEPSVGVAIDVVKSVNFRILNSTFEGGISSGSVGVDIRGGYLRGFIFQNNYMEAVDIGLHTNGGNLLTGIISGNTCIVSNYIIRTTTGVIGRNMQIFGNFIETSGGTTFNTIEIDTEGSDATIHVGGEIVSNASPYPTFPVRRLATTTTCIGNLNFLDFVGNLIAKDQGALYNAGRVSPAPFTGRQMITEPYGLPFAYVSNVEATSLKILTNLYWDDSQTLVFNYKLQDLSARHNIHGTVYGSTIYQLSPLTGSAAVTIATSTNDRIVVTISDINTGASGSYNISGMIRHH